MAHEIYLREAEKACPRCGAGYLTIATYHFGNTYSAECTKCGLGHSFGDDEAMAIARQYGRNLKFRLDVGVITEAAQPLGTSPESA